MKYFSGGIRDEIVLAGPDLLVFVCGMWDVQKFKAGLKYQTRQKQQVN